MIAMGLYAVDEPPTTRPWKEAFMMPAAFIVPWCFFASATSLILLLLLLTAVVTDVRWNRIFNWTTYTALAWAFGLGLLATIWNTTDLADTRRVESILGTSGIEQIALGAIASFAAMFVLFYVFGGGAGDVKLMTAVGALVGIERGIWAWCVACIAAACVVFALLIRRRGVFGLLAELFFRMRLPHVSAWFGGPSNDFPKLLKSHMPMGPFFAIGVLFAVNV